MKRDLLDWTNERRIGTEFLILFAGTQYVEAAAVSTVAMLI